MCPMSTQVDTGTQGYRRSISVISMPPGVPQDANLQAALAGIPGNRHWLWLWQGGQRFTTLAKFAAPAPAAPADLSVTSVEQFLATQTHSSPATLRYAEQSDATTDAELQAWRRQERRH